MSEITISHLNKAKLLTALYNKARPLGMGFLHYKEEDMTIIEAEKLLAKTKYFDYLYGRVMKVDLSKDILRTSLYNRDNGIDAAENIIKTIEK